MGRHSSLTHFYPWMTQEFGVGKDHHFSMCSGIAHDPLQRDVFTPLFFGAPIYIPEEVDIMTPGRLAEWFEKHSITITCLTPAAGQLLTSISDANFKLNHLKLVFFVGDQLLKRLKYYFEYKLKKK